MTSSARANRLLNHAVLATAVAVAAVAVVFLLARAASDPLVVAPELGGGDAKPLSFELALLATVAGGGIGLGLATVARSSPSRAAPIFVASCLVGLVAYGALAAIRSQHTSTAIWLNAMHLAAAVPIVGLLARRLRRQSLG